MLNRLGSSLLLLCALHLPSPEAVALSVAPRTPAQVAAASSDIVIATITRATREPRADGSTVEHLDLDVLACWKGRCVPHLRRTQVLSVVDAMHPERGAREVAGNLRLRVGVTYLLFLRAPAASPRLPVTTAGDLGAYVAIRTGTRAWRFETLDGRRIRAVTSDGFRHDTDTSEVISPVVPAPRYSIWLSARPPSPLRSTQPATSLDVALAWQTVISEVPW